MNEFQVPCDTVARLATILDSAPPELHPSFRTMRIEGNLVIVTDRRFMAVEHVTGGNGVCHISLTPELIERCRVERNFNANLIVQPNDMLKFTVIRTSLGWNAPANYGYYGPIDPDWNNWRTVVSRTAQTLETPHGGMMWDAEGIARLASCSPSGRVVFEAVPTNSSNRPTIIRDITDPYWFGVFQPYDRAAFHTPAALPDWFQTS